ncbi:hypothetical protein C6502_04305 [Candidatus Poribacteria bacterium]|nr:MAG: hypothetical protein C6502_04305 [Candidatus Poribacteria bacterium]
MKEFQRVIFRSFLWLVTFCAVLVIGITGCGGDSGGADNDAGDNKWVGTWSLETFDGQTLEQVLEQQLGTEGVTVSIVTNNWTFNDDGTLEAEISFKLGNQGEDSPIAITSSNKTTGTYSLSGSNYTLTLEEIPIASLKENTGTWSREGNTLTLNSDDGETITFNKN